VQKPRNSDLKSVSFGNLPEHGITTAELREKFGDIAGSSTNWGSSNFIGFPDAGNGIAALGAAVLIPFLNQNLTN
jgi:glutamate/tyrosine decarboxylase-like PLP-dependent enzyme